MAVANYLETALKKRPNGTVEYVNGKTEEEVAAELSRLLKTTVRANNVATIRTEIMPGRLVGRWNFEALANARSARSQRIANLEAENAELRRALETITNAIRPKAAE